VRVLEQNSADATFGFGVVFSDRALEFLQDDDPETCDLIACHMETWRDITLVHRGETVTIDGVGFSSIGRLHLLQLLQQRARSAGAVLHFGRVVTSPDELGDFDLIVAADGLNSVARRTHEGDFATSLSYLDSKFIWYGTTKLFPTLTQTFIESEYGAFNAHHYRYSANMSTFIIECNRPTWLRAKFHEMGDAESRALCESLFAESLEGHPLISNKSIWRNFPQLWSDRWSFRNVVLTRCTQHTIQSGPVPDWRLRIASRWSRHSRAIQATPKVGSATTKQGESQLWRRSLRPRQRARVGIPRSSFI
jgi:2-polyprenyl-6-methoxyphenol hydroxylase-like FAD-dependent oxidoreductase